MKAVLISIRPKWCELIASGKKTIEVRKTRPKLEPPFKCYIYCTKDPGNKGSATHFFESDEGTFWSAGKTFAAFLSGTVIGEFVCDKMYKDIVCGKIAETDILCLTIQSEHVRKSACLSEKELYEYSNGKHLYGWQISDLVIYDKPKELSEFNGVCNRTYCYQNCEKYSTCRASGKYIISRQPQSWMYVEELV